MARGLGAISDVDLTVVVNVGDDETVHGLHVSPDIDTVIYTLAGVEGPEGWGRAGDTFVANEELGRFGVDNRFRLGDLDIALNLYRTNRLTDGVPLSKVTAELSSVFEVGPRVVPATDDPLRTEVRLDDGWTSFQDYFVIRANRDEVRELRYRGSEIAKPAPGVLEAITGADLVVIAPSNPPLSIWPVLAVAPIREAVANHTRVCVVSPLIAGRALKGPADRVMASLGLPPGNRGICEAYRGLVDTIVIDDADAAEADTLPVEVVVTDIRIADATSARRLARQLVSR